MRTPPEPITKEQVYIGIAVFAAVLLMVVAAEWLNAQFALSEETWYSEQHEARWVQKIEQVSRPIHFRSKHFTIDIHLFKGGRNDSHISTEAGRESGGEISQASVGEFSDDSPGK